MCHQWYFYESLETFTLEDVLDPSSLVQPEAFNKTLGLATILPGNTIKGLTEVFLSVGRGGEKNQPNKKKPLTHHNTQLSYHGPMFTKYFSGEKTKQNPASRMTTSVR